MSAATARLLPAPPSAPPVTRLAASLRLVPQRRSTAAKAPFVVAVVCLLVAGLLGLLLLNTVVAQDAFRLHDLQKQGRVLADREQELAKQVQALQAPGSLSDRARALGMVAGGAPVFLRLPDGAVLGSVTAPGAAPAPPVVPAAAPVKPVAAAAPAPARSAAPVAHATPAAPRSTASAAPTAPPAARHAPAHRAPVPAPRPSGGTR